MIRGKMKDYPYPNVKFKFAKRDHHQIFLFFNLRKMLKHSSESEKSYIAFEQYGHRIYPCYRIEHLELYPIPMFS